METVCFGLYPSNSLKVIYHGNPGMILSEYAASYPDLFSSWTIQDLPLQEHVHMEDDKSVGKTIAKLNVLEGDGERRLKIFRVGSTIFGGGGGGGGGEQRKFETNYQSKFFFPLILNILYESQLFFKLMCIRSYSLKLSLF